MGDLERALLHMLYWLTLAAPPKNNNPPSSHFSSNPPSAHFRHENRHEHMEIDHTNTVHFSHTNTTSFSHHRRDEGEAGASMRGGGSHEDTNTNAITYKLVGEMPCFIFQAVNCLNTHLKVYQSHQCSLSTCTCQHSSRTPINTLNNICTYTTMTHPLTLLYHHTLTTLILSHLQGSELLLSFRLILSHDPPSHPIAPPHTNPITLTHPFTILLHHYTLNTLILSHYQSSELLLSFRLIRDIVTLCLRTPVYCDLCERSLREFAADMTEVIHPHFFALLHMLSHDTPACIISTCAFT